MSSNHITKVAVVGAGGNSGSYILAALLKTGTLTVTALTRSGSTPNLPDSVVVKEVNYDDPSTLVAALRGQDALVITLGVAAPPGTEAKLVEAAAEANVAWILPNDWKSDSGYAFMSQVNPDSVVQKTLDLITKLGKSSYISVHTGPWYEWSVALPVAYGFDFKKREAVLYDDGDTAIDMSTWPQVGRAAASILSLPVHGDGPSLEQFKNTTVYTSSFTASQKDVLASVLRVTKTTLDDWKITKQSSEERLAEGLKQLQEGDHVGFQKALYARLFFADSRGSLIDDKRANKILGLSEEDIDEATKVAIERAKATGTA